jgi:hypothetical protein
MSDEDSAQLKADCAFSMRKGVKRLTSTLFSSLIPRLVELFQHRIFSAHWINVPISDVCKTTIAFW